MNEKVTTNFSIDDRSRPKIWKKFQNLFLSCFKGSNNEELFDKDGSLIDPNRLRDYLAVKNCSQRERQMIWPYLLNLYSTTMNNKQKKIFQNQSKLRYHKLKQRWQQRLAQSDPFYVRLADLIRKDISRTDQHLRFFKKKKQILFNIMMTFSVYHPNPSYSQGMSDMLTPIVYIFDDESMSYFAYCSLMTRYMKNHFDRDHQEIFRRFRLFDFLIQSIDKELWKQFQINDEENLHLFFYRWFLLDCKREFHQIDQILRLMELVWLYSMPRFANSVVTSNSSSIFTVFLSISILQEDRKKIFLFSSDEDFHHYFFTSSLSTRSRSSSTTKRIFHRAQLYHSLYQSISHQ